MVQELTGHIFYNEYRPDAQANENSKVLVFDGQNIFLKKVMDGDTIKNVACPTVKELEIAPEKLQYAFAIDEEEYFLDLSGAKYEEQDYQYYYLRELLQTQDNCIGLCVLTGYHLYSWYEDCKFCGRCGAKMVHTAHERAMHCDVCNKNFYPRIMPAVIVGVINGDKLLLSKYKEGYKFYSLIAGFTEIGESLEQTVAREVMEEVGLKVKNIRYYGSQPWGIANDLLVGYFCDVDGSTEPVIDTSELKLAEWKTREEIEAFSNSPSLTGTMMYAFKIGEPV